MNTASPPWFDHPQRGEALSILLTAAAVLLPTLLLLLSLRISLTRRAGRPRCAVRCRRPSEWRRDRGGAAGGAAGSCALARRRGGGLASVGRGDFAPPMRLSASDAATATELLERSRRDECRKMTADLLEAVRDDRGASARWRLVECVPHPQSEAAGKAAGTAAGKAAVGGAAETRRGGGRDGRGITSCGAAEGGGDGRGSGSRARSSGKMVVRGTRRGAHSGDSGDSGGEHSSGGGSASGRGCRGEEVGESVHHVRVGPPGDGRVFAMVHQDRGDPCVYRFKAWLPCSPATGLQLHQATAVRERWNGGTEAPRLPLRVRISV